MNISSAITVNYINKLRTTNYELIMKTNPNKPNFQTRETCPEPVERACPELVEGACPELVEGACPATASTRGGARGGELGEG